MSAIQGLEPVSNCGHAQGTIFSMFEQVVGVGLSMYRSRLIQAFQFMCLCTPQKMSSKQGTPAMPMASPTSDSLRAGASLVPSPVTATTSPDFFSALTSVYLSVGELLASTCVPLPYVMWSGQIQRSTDAPRTLNTSIVTLFVSKLSCEGLSAHTLPGARSGC